ncbi:hypothetical protein FB451DRAFT_780603 [Mycena latifolia]|nr:hypothetical protein FB451DRAFT_780603 [Mycena latifolia]
MPYSVPGVVAPPPPSPPAMGRPGHRRSYTFAQDDPRAGPGAFASLGALPRRTRSHSHHTPSPAPNALPAPTSPPASPRRAGPHFHFRADEDGDSSESSEEQPAQAAQDDDDGPPPPLRLRQPPPGPPALAFRLTPPTRFRPSPPRSPAHSPRGSPTSSSANLTLNTGAVPFPRAGSPLSPHPASPLPTRPPGPARTASTPVILLSNGKPLKSSLKSSSSAPHMPPHGHPAHHLRARSAPSTPSLSSSPSTSGSASGEGEGWEQGGAESPGTPKNVRFPAPDAGLETVLLFKRRARPASVSLGGEDETETETETDSAPRWMSASSSAYGSASTSSGGYPFPRVGPSGGRSPLNPNGKKEEEGKWRYALDAPGVPRKAEPASMVLLEGLTLEGPQTPPAGGPATGAGELTLRGTLLVRNAAFEKHLFVRFTLDGWCTTSEVGARWVESGVAPPSQASSSSSSLQPAKEEPGPGWDRFAFSIRLTDYAAGASRLGGMNGGAGVGGVGRGLEGRELVLVARFWAPWVGPGGVGPYVWCDALAPSPSPGQGAGGGTGTSPSGRAWVGAGGGGPGEWWDNNGGRDYRVGFKIVAVAEPPAGVATPALVPSTIPFPTTGDEDVPSTASTATTSTSITSPPSASPAPSTPSGSPPSHNPGPPPSQPPPPPPPRTAHAQALAAKLGRLSLRNYAAPGAPRVSPPLPFATLSSSSSTSPPASTEKPKDEGKEGKNEDGKKEESKMSPAPGQTSSGGVGLYWPWGRGSASPPATSTTFATASAGKPAPIVTFTPSSPPAHVQTQQQKQKEEEEDRSSDADADELDAEDRDGEEGEGEAETETPPTSPLASVGEVEDSDATVTGTAFKTLLEARNVALPVSPSPTPSPPGERLEVPPASADASSSLYKAFVRQWCFAGAGGRVGAPGVGMGGGGAAVKS